MRPIDRTSISAAALSLWTVASHVAAQNLQVLTNTIPGCNFYTGRLTTSCIPLFIGHIIKLVFSVISVFFLINVLIAGYQIAFGYINGDKSDGIERLKWSVIGLVVSMCSYLILDVVITVISP